MSKKIKSYSSVWRVEKILHAISDYKLPFPITFFQMGCFSVTLILVILWKDSPPLNLMGSDMFLVKFLGIPFGVTWFLSKKTFDGKKPLNFLITVFLYIFRPKTTFGGKAVRFQKQYLTAEFLVSRTERKRPFDFFQYTEMEDTGQEDIQPLPPCGELDELEEVGQ